MSEIPKTTKSRLGGILILIFTLAVIGIVVFNLRSALSHRVAQLRQTLAYIQSDYTFARFKVNSISKISISFELSLLDLDGKTIATTNLELAGKDIFIESRVVILKGSETNKALVFPLRIYSDAIPEKDGVDIRSLYVTDNTPRTYISTNMGYMPRTTIRRIYETVFVDDKYFMKVKDKTIDRIFDVAPHQFMLKSFSAGEVYKCLIHPNGAIELIKQES